MAVRKRIGGLLGRALVVSTTTMLALATLAIPARAEAVATAQFTTDRTVLAGTAEDEHTIRVTNAEPQAILGGRSIDFVRITTPTAQFQAVNVAPPAGWSGFVEPLSGSMFFFADDDNSAIPPNNGAAEFTFTANAGRPCGDRNHNWTVGVSSDGGENIASAAVTPGGSLTTILRVLQVVDVALTSPTGVLDNTVTATQDNVTAATRVQNAGGCALSVEAQLGGGSGASTVSATTSDNPQSIPSQGEATYNFAVTFAAAGSVVLSGDATSTDPAADAINGQGDQITVMTKAALNYVGGSLSPRAVNPSSGTPAFSVNLNKTGAVAVGVDTANSLFQFGPNDEYTTTLASPSSIGGGNVSGVAFQFNALSVPPSLDDGNYSVRVTVPVLDENDFGYTLVPGVGDQVNLDRLIPVPLPDINVGMSQVMGETPAATDGKTINFNGTITDGGSLCGACTVTDSYLLQYNDVGAEIADSRIDVNVTNSGGTMSGSYSDNYHPDAHFIELFVTVSDNAGNVAVDVGSTDDGSPLTHVDNIVPHIQSARSGGPNGQNRSRIDVTFNEFVASTVVLASDFACDDHVVVSATPDGTSARFRSVTLMVTPELTQDEQPVCTYEPAEEPHDRVGLLVATPVAVNVADGIIPPLPTLGQVSGLPRQDDGEFWTNQTAPVFRVDAVTAGHDVFVYEDLNGNGQVDPGVDDELCTAQVPASTPGDDAPDKSVDCNSKDLGTVERGLGILIVARDASGNLGLSAGEALNLDFTAPAFAAAVQLPQEQVQVTFTEDLVRGSNFASNWTVKDGEEESEPYQIGSVSGSNSTRTLTIDDPNFSDSTALAQVIYHHLAAQRYQDRAGNNLPNFVGSF